MKHLLTLACAIFSLCFLSPQVAAHPNRAKDRNAKNDTWLLQQLHTDVGMQDVYVAPDGARIANRRSGYELICKAPKWDVHCFRRSEKLEWIAPLSLFDGLLLGNPNAEPHVNKSIYFPKSTSNKLGIVFTHFTPRNGSRSSVDGSADIVTDPRVVEFLCRFYRCPNTQTVPLQIGTEHGKRVLPKFRMGRIGMDSGNDLRNGLVEELTTVSCKKIPYNANDFALPLNFKRTMNIAQVSFSNNMKQEFNEMFREGTGFRSDTR